MARLPTLIRTILFHLGLSAGNNRDLLAAATTSTKLSLSAQAGVTSFEPLTQQELWPPPATPPGKTARLATLEVEDNQSIETPIAYETLLKALVSPDHRR